MRIRSIKPEFWRSQDISRLSIEDRLLFIGLWSYVDDNGVGKNDVAIIAADLFAHDLSREPIETLSRVSEGLKRLYSASLVDLYEVDGRPYLYISTWETHQRVNNPNKPRYPTPTSANETLSRPYVEPIETLPPGTGEQGNRGTGEQGNSSSSSGAADAPPTETRDDITEILDLLDDAITQSGFDKPNRTKTNLDAARLLIDKDQRTLPEIRAAINYLPSDEFWRTNIRSMSKFREKWEQLKGSAQRQQSRRANQYRNQNQIVQDMQVRAAQQTAMQQASARALIEGAA